MRKISDKTGGQAHGGKVTATMISRDGQQAVSTSEDGSLKVWDLQNFAERFTLQDEISIVAAAVTPDGERVITIGYEYAYVYGNSIFSANVKIWELKAEASPVILCESRDDLIKDVFTAVTITPDGQQAILTRRADEYPHKAPAAFELWSLETLQRLKMWENHENWLTALAITPEGNSLLASLEELKVWDLQAVTNAPIVLGRHHSQVTSVAVTLDGGQAVSGARDGTIKVWNLETKAELVTLTGHDEIVNAVHMFPSRNFFLTVADDHSLKVWDLARSQMIATFFGESGLTCCDIAPHGMTIIAGEESGRVHFLRLEGV